MPKKFEKPPDEKEAEVSGTPVVPPTDVMLRSSFSDDSRNSTIKTYKGQPEGKVARKLVQRVVCEPATPPSPEENRMEVPRAPSEAYAVQRLLHNS